MTEDGKERIIDRIVLTDVGEALIPRTGASTGTRRPAPLDWAIGYGDNRHVADHETCNNPVALVRVSATHRALLCHHCGLRVVIPNAVETWGQLYRFFVSLQTRSDDGRRTRPVPDGPA